MNITSDRSLLYVYQSPINPLPWWRGRLITVIRSRGEILAEVWEKGVCHQLPLHGIPKVIVNRFQILKKFFDASFFFVGKNEDRTFSRVEVRPCLKGGVITASDLLPMYPGYAIGSVISKEKLYLPILNRKKDVFEKELKQATLDKEKMLVSEAYQKADQMTKQKMLVTAAFKVKTAEEKYKDIWNKIGTLCEEAHSSDQVEEMLAIDSNASGLRWERRAFASEQMNHLIFRKNEKGEVPIHDELLEQVEKFIGNLDSEQVSSSSIHPNTLDSLVGNIQKMLKSEMQISLVGSFITLPRVILMDPVKLRKGAVLSEHLLDNASNYYVLVEAVLGAVFLGLGKLTSKEYSPEEEKKMSPEAVKESSFMSRLAMLSFHSQGAIPQPSKNAEDINLWTVYCKWKETLEKDDRSGYPIAFRVKRLKDVLTENQIALTGKTDEKKTE